MDHSHHRHDHHATAEDAGNERANERRAALAFALTATFMVVEAVGGWLSGSLALIADAAHMLTDALALLMAWAAFRLGRMSADSRRSYGYRRIEILAAFINGLSVLVLSAWIAWEAVSRLNDPQPVAGVTMLVIAALGLVVNGIVLSVLGGHGHSHSHGDHDYGEENLNLRGAMLHVLGDLLGSGAAIVAAGVILVWGWTPIDPLLSLGVAVLILFSALRLIRQASHILLEGTPEGFNADTLSAHLLDTVPQLASVHHIHAWSVTSGQVLLTLHVRLKGDDGHDRALHAIKRQLEDRFRISHSVVQVEGAHCPDHDCL